MGIEFPVGVIKCLELDKGGGCTILSKYWVIHFKMVNIVLCKSHFSKKKK